LSQRLPRQDRY